MIEREMDYRGSKSRIEGNIFVKEQRVDGSWRGIYNPLLRCTLTGFERNYQIRILSKQINTQIRSIYFYRTLQQSLIENPVKCTINKMNP